MSREALASLLQPTLHRPLQVSRSSGRRESRRPRRCIRLKSSRLRQSCPSNGLLSTGGQGGPERYRAKILKGQFIAVWMVEKSYSTFEIGPPAWSLTRCSRFEPF